MSSTFQFVVAWREAPMSGRVEVRHGRLEALFAQSGVCEGDIFQYSTSGASRLRGEIDDAMVETGAFATRITIHSTQHSFSFFARDVTANTPIFIPDYGLAVLPGDDERTYDQVETDVRSLGLIAEWQRINDEPEETYEGACARNRNQKSPVWLGLSRDIRIFTMGFDENHGFWNQVQPRYHCTIPRWPEIGLEPGKEVSITFSVGRGASCEVDVTSRLEDGTLPIVHSELRDGEVSYQMWAFVTLETQPISTENLRGTHHVAAFANSSFGMITPEQQEYYRNFLDKPEVYEREEETVCVLRFRATNHGRVPRYAFFKGPQIKTVWEEPLSHPLYNGLSTLPSGRVFAAHLLNGKPMPQREVAVLLQPGETAVCLMLIPHQPLPNERAQKLLAFDYQEHFEGCRDFWKTKLNHAAQIHLPEPAVDERLKAGLLHCDIVAYGREPDGLVATAIGWYAPIGSESAPIIQFFDSMGWHDLARRSIEYFLDLQRDDGFIQTYCNYQLETGPVLWTMGEHYRYTRDDHWVASLQPKILKACEYLLNWRNRNKREELRGAGYGLQDGKVGDPDDFFHSFMLNAVSYLGLARAAEMLRVVNAAEAERLQRECDEYRADLRTAYLEAVSRAPVIPLGDGSWVPSFSPWTEYPGPVALYAQGGDWYTHGSFASRDSLAGAQYLVLADVFSPDELPATHLLRCNQELFTQSNAAFSQPYYCRNDYMHARRGEVKEFLKTYYNQFTAIQDRQTYNFWEHYYHVSEHKTHEEAWFLMQTRWMLYMEEENTLRLLPMMPRKWLQSGKEIKLENVASYFGPFSLHVQSRLDSGTIEARITCAPSRGPREIVLRLPHPQGQHPLDVRGGEYDFRTETVRIVPFHESAEILLRYA